MMLGVACVYAHLVLFLCPETVDYQVAIGEEVGEDGRMDGGMDGW